MKLKFFKRLICVGAAVFTLVVSALVISGLNDQLGKADVALVLGNKVDPHGIPSSRLRARLDKTLDLYFGAYFPLVIVSGGIGQEGFDEAQVMCEYLITGGIPKDSIIVDSAGINTLASANNTLNILQKLNKKSVFVISQYFHLPRSRLALERLGIAPVYSAHANFFEARDLYSIVREIVGYVKYSIQTYGYGK